MGSEDIVEKAVDLPLHVEPEKKSEDEGFVGSENDLSSDDDNLKDKEKQSNDILPAEKELSPKTVDHKSENHIDKPDEPVKKEKEDVIKNRIMNIINDAKQMDQKRNTFRKNFGRNFEFQNIQLKPVVPNDRRPQKAKRMDDMWSQVTKTKETTMVNNMTPKP